MCHTCPYPPLASPPSPPMYLSMRCSLAEGACAPGKAVPCPGEPRKRRYCHQGRMGTALLPSTLAPLLTRCCHSLPLSLPGLAYPALPLLPIPVPIHVGVRRGHQGRVRRRAGDRGWVCGLDGYVGWVGWGMSGGLGEITTSSLLVLLYAYVSIATSVSIVDPWFL